MKKTKPSPKLHKIESRVRTIHIRFTLDEVERMAEQAQAAKLTLSEWVRNSLNMIVETSRGEHQL